MTERQFAANVWRNTVRNAFVVGITTAACVAFGGMLIKVAFWGLVVLIVFQLLTSIPAILKGLVTPFFPRLRRSVDSVGWSLVATIGRIADDAVVLALAYFVYQVL